VATALDIFEHRDAVGTGAVSWLVEDEADSECRDGLGITASAWHGLRVVVGITGDGEGGVVAPQQLVLGPAAAAWLARRRWSQVGIAVITLADVVGGVRVGGGVALRGRYPAGEGGDRGRIDADRSVPVRRQVLIYCGDRGLQDAVADAGEGLTEMLQQLGVCRLDQVALLGELAQENAKAFLVLDFEGLGDVSDLPPVGRILAEQVENLNSAWPWGDADDVHRWCLVIGDLRRLRRLIRWWLAVLGVQIRVRTEDFRPAPLRLQDPLDELDLLADFVQQLSCLTFLGLEFGEGALGVGHRSPISQLGDSLAGQRVIATIRLIV
jgi:hypothetical protein